MNYSGIPKDADGGLMVETGAAGELTQAEIEAVRAPLEHASFLPPRVYSDAGIFECERRNVLLRTWLPVCHVSQLETPGSYYARIVAGEPVVVTRDRQNELRVLSNVCRHRNAVIARDSGACRGNRLICPYHGWAYALDGKLLAAPAMNRTADFTNSEVALPTVRHEVWQGFVFVNFDPAAPALAPQLGSLLPKIAPYQLGRMAVVPVRRATVAWNWKVSMENFTEGYHQPLVHPITANRDLPADEIVYEDSDGPFSYFRLPHVSKQPTPTIAPPVSGMPESYYREFAVFNIYPLLHLFLDAATPLWLDWEIRSPTEHELIWYMMVDREHLNEGNREKLKADFLGFIEPILQEDVFVCSAVGAGVRSTLARPGRLSWMEKSVHQFQNWWLEQYLRA